MGGSAPVPPGGGVIDVNNRFAYGELSGWLDMKPTGGGVYVYNNRLDGFAYGELVGLMRFSGSGYKVVTTWRGQ